MGKALNLKNMIAAYEAVYVEGLEIGRPCQDIEETAREVWRGFYTMCQVDFIPWETWDKFFDHCKAIDCESMAETLKEGI